MLTYCVSRRYWRKIVASSTQSRETCFQVPHRQTPCLLATRFKSISCADIPGEAAGNNLVTIMSSLERIIVFGVQLTQLNCNLARLLHWLLIKEKGSKIFWDLIPINENIFPNDENMFSVMGMNNLLLLLHSIEVD
jgi:hypothetical protein